MQMFDFYGGLIEINFQSSPSGGIFGKNVQSLFKVKVAPYSGLSVYVENADIKKIMENKVNDYVTNKKDLNTALREAEEEINKHIDQIKK